MMGRSALEACATLKCYKTSRNPAELGCNLVASSYCMYAQTAGMWNSRCGETVGSLYTSAPPAALLFIHRLTQKASLWSIQEEALLELLLLRLGSSHPSDYRPVWRLPPTCCRLSPQSQAYHHPVT